MDCEKKRKVMRLFEENTEADEDAPPEPSPCHLPTIQFINYGTATITSRDIQITITVSVS